MDSRLSSIYKAIKELTIYGRYFDIDSNYSELRSYTEQLWPCFLNQHIHYDCESVVSDEINSPWSVALTNKISENIPNNLLGDTCKKFLYLEELLPFPQRFIYTIYENAKNLAFYLRLDSDYIEKYKDLNDVVSKILGYCFSEFDSDGIYCKTYLIQRIMHIIYFTVDSPIITELETREYFSPVLLEKSILDFDLNITTLIKLHYNIMTLSDKVNESNAFENAFIMMSIITLFKIYVYHSGTRINEILNIIQNKLPPKVVQEIEKELNNSLYVWREKQESQSMIYDCGKHDGIDELYYSFMLQ
jgi:hypothetical protein